MSAPTQQLIADKLNIARTTVSRCFTNHKGINPKTRAKVFSLAAKLGYQYLQPRSPAKNAGDVRTIGVLICSDVEEYNRDDYESPGVELVPGIAEYAQLNHLHTEMHFVPPNAKSISDPCFSNITALRKRLWAGVILIYPFSPTIIGELAARFPCTSLVEQYGWASIDCVDVNHYKGITILMDRLRQKGHKRIGFFSRKYAVEAAWSYRRFSAYVENLARFGRHYDERDVVHLDATSSATTNVSYQQVVDRMNDGVTAWVCAADHQAYDLIIALKERGLSVPGDASITGFDGILRPQNAPALDTVRIPYYEIGFSGCRRLLDRINQRFDVIQEIMLECRLQEGETVGPPRVTD